MSGSLSVAQDEGEKQIFSGTCKEFPLDQVPVGDFKSMTVLPQDPYNVNQWYNTPTEEGYWSDGVWIYGHDGIDSEGTSDTEGVNDVVATQKGIVILSESENDTNGWGESIIMATRTNQASEEILTFHYHHLYNNGQNGINYDTTRRFSACETVNRGAVIGKEGNTGNSAGSHLHLSVRRWKNLKELKNAIQGRGSHLFGHGYTFGNESRIQKHLHPHALFFKYFLDYQNPDQAYMWSEEYVQKMRNYGIEFGLFNGSYGAQQPATRGEVARWLKTALGISSVKNVSPTFNDVAASDPLFPYLEALTRFPTAVANTENAVINPLHSCTQNQGKNFCPDNSINRAEALKMMIVSLYYSEFDSFQKQFFWLTKAADVLDVLSVFLNISKTQFFQDVDIHEWFAPYVYFGVWKELVQLQPNFNPAQFVMREEMAKWIIKAYELKNSSYNSLCDNVSCPSGHHCNPDSGVCDENSECIPSETKDCAVGGGINESSCVVNDCNPGEIKSQDCGTGGTQTASCTDECAWTAWGDCEGSGSCEPTQTLGCGNCGTMTCQADGQWGACETQGFCTPGETQQQSCDGSGTQVRSCNGVCAWDSWGVCQNGCTCAGGECCDGCNYISSGNSCDLSYEFQCEGSSPGQNVQRRQVMQYCTGYDAGCSGSINYGSWQTWEDCSSSQECEYVSGTPGCVGSCIKSTKLNYIFKFGSF